jgi:hypothetical protein
MATITDTLVVCPSSYDTTDYQWRHEENLDNGYTPSSSTTVATIYATTGRNAETWIYYIFDTSAIPAGATIVSVACTVKARSYGSSITTRTAQMYSGSTAKGSATALGTNANTVSTLNVGSWTLAELSNARIKIYGQRGTANTTATSHCLEFRGATLTITYSYEAAGQDIFVKQNGTWEAVDSIFVKQNGAWVQVDEMYIKDNGTWKS